MADLTNIRNRIAGTGTIVTELANSDEEEREYWAKIYNVRIKAILKDIDALLEENRATAYVPEPVREEGPVADEDIEEPEAEDIPAEEEPVQVTRQRADRSSFKL